MYQCKNEASEDVYQKWQSNGIDKQGIPENA